MSSTSADVDELRRLMPPPAGDTRPVDWTRLADTWERPFPPDYRRFMAEYGPGTVQDYLSVLEPEPKGPLDQARMDGMLEETANAEDEWADGGKSPELEDTEPLLITWAVSASADLLCWDATDPDPAKWPVLVNYRGKLRWDRYEGGMAAFLTKVLKADLPDCPLGDVTLWGRGSADFVRRG
ncbi:MULTISPECIES: hypothetical protein [Streptomyces]|uniref:Knr4/Smi1-like domain-containing protein n=1 Tax=Streptomyces solicathayae TaxID=3081768 RepID=A0ABZ0M402_9ACTN|nr:hypothetical protein [Streptomyces sp. HUAS YS2]WOX26457.1 hypothetical protein R2D22_35810 [Streptomyces sp. HUAS YS2]